MALIPIEYFNTVVALGRQLENESIQYTATGFIYGFPSGESDENGEALSSYLPYQEIAVSQQTGRPRMIFEENSGLGVVVPCDIINETVEIAIDKLNLKKSEKE